MAHLGEVVQGELVPLQQLQAISSSTLIAKVGARCCEAGWVMRVMPCRQAHVAAQLIPVLVHCVRALVDQTVSLTHSCSTGWTGTALLLCLSYTAASECDMHASCSHLRPYLHCVHAAHMQLTPSPPPPCLPPQYYKVSAEELKVGSAADAVALRIASKECQ